MSEEVSKANWIKAVIEFWFEELTPEDWFRNSEATDSAIRLRFANLYERLLHSLPDECDSSPSAALAGIIVLDQFPRNMFRGSPKSFATDAMALALSDRSISRGLDKSLNIPERKFLFMPFQHSEDKSVQARSIQLFAKLGDKNTLEYAKRHKNIIDRFGRFPHRNEILGRNTTAEEAAFLKEPGSSF